jgi:hypothetical protein
LVTPLGKGLFHLQKGVVAFHGLMINYGKKNAGGKNPFAVLACGTTLTHGSTLVFGQ